MDYRNLNTIYG